MSESQYHDEMRMNYVLVVVFSYEEEQSYQQLKLHEFLNSPDQQKCFIPARRARSHFSPFRTTEANFAISAQYQQHSGIRERDTRYRNTGYQK